jgi:hypothetical protein
MSIEPKTERTDDTAVEERKADQPSSTAEVARDLERSETGSRADAEEEAAATLFPEDETREFRSRWTDIQTGFVDEPRRAVEQADLSRKALPRDWSSPRCLRQRRFCVCGELDWVKNSEQLHVAQHCFYLPRARSRDLF